LNTILLPIRPEYVRKILAGSKKYEFRKRQAKSKIDYILIYSTNPIMKVVASAEVVDVLNGAPSTLWEMTKSVAGISRQKYREYFRGSKIAYAYKLGAIQVFDPPKTLQDFDISAIPQSFVYVKKTDNLFR
jgi:Uncharacterized conserved protein